ncbi:MAG: hypothetical protein DDT30_01412 [Dehalococcoidia bacterium]|nr:hypothetical protein [Bacillota bacterium]MBT9144114.1 hypothetical protein [Bacillota bacterium]
MAEIQLFVDGRELTVGDSKTILEAATENRVYIPPSLSSL